MIVTLNGNIATEVKAQYMMKDGQYVPDNRTGKPLVVTEFHLAVSRNGKTKTMPDGKTYDSDLYRVKAYGQKAEYLAQYASKGRGVCIQGNLLQDEYPAQNQTVQIDRNNALYNVLAQYVTQPNSPIKADQYGNLYILGTTQAKSVTLEVVNVDFTGPNPNGQHFDQTAFVPNMGAQQQGIMPSGLPTAMPQAGMPLTPPVAQPQQAFTPNQQFTPNAQVPFGANAQSNVIPGINQQPQQQFVPQQQSQQFAPQQPQANNFQPMMNGGIQPNVNGATVVQPQQNPNGVMPSFPGFNEQSEVPSDFTNIMTPQQNVMPQVQVQPQQSQQVAQQPQQATTEQPKEDKDGAQTSNFTPEQKGGANQGF